MDQVDDIEPTGDLSSEDEDERRFAIMDASQRSDAAALPKLLGLLQTDTYSNRRHIVRALGHIGGIEAEKTLLRLLPNESGLILGDLARAIGERKLTAARDELQALLDHKLEWVRSNAQWALKQLGDKL